MMLPLWLLLLYCLEHKNSHSSPHLQSILINSLTPSRYKIPQSADTGQLDGDIHWSYKVLFTLCSQWHSRQPFLFFFLVLNKIIFIELFRLKKSLEIKSNCILMLATEKRTWMLPGHLGMCRYDREWGSASLSGCIWPDHSHAHGLVPHRLSR